MIPFEISTDRKSLKLSTGIELPALWLKDNGEDAATRDPASGQRLHDIVTSAAEISIVSADHADDGLSLSFDDGDSPTSLSWAFLENLSDPIDAKAAIETWGSADLSKLPTISFDAFLNQGRPLHDWLAGFERFGFGRIQNGPKLTESLFDLIHAFGYVRETNYGRHFEVRTKPNPENLAYTGLGLPPHTDNPYREPVPGLQLLYCLENSATGGESQVVDGFAAALALRAENPAAFDVLTKTPVAFGFNGQNGVHLHATRPLIETDVRGDLVSVCYNTRSMQPLLPRSGLDLGAFYAAYHQFGRLLNDAQFMIEFSLEAGEAFLVNNRRVLHARAGFKADGNRWLQGAYADLDSLQSRRRSLAQELGL